MKKFNLLDFKGGWVIGNFSPSITFTEEFEFGVKNFLAGDVEPEHFQVVASEVTIIVSGLVEIGGKQFGPGEICLLSPGDVADFKALENGALAVVKFPSDPQDKRMVT